MKKALKTTGGVLLALALTGALVSQGWAGGHVTAADVKDKESLKGFVKEAIAHLKKKGYDGAVKDFRTKGQWRKGSIYLFGVAKDGTSVFHVAQPKLEGTIIGVVDEDGVRITEELVKAALKGDGFVSYRWDDPATKDTDKAVPKVSYAEAFKKDGEEIVIGAGFYPKAM